MNIDAIQIYLKEHELNGWLLADFHGNNDIFVGLLEIRGMLTRRAFYYIPAIGKPTALVNPIEKERFHDLPGQVIVCKGYNQLEERLEELLKGTTRVAMEYSPGGRLPYVAKVDAGTVEMIRRFGPEVISSADLVSNFRARLSVEKIAAHRIAARNIIEIKNRVFALIGSRVKAGETITELNISDFILDQFKEQDMVTDHAPNCSVNGHAGNPHYEPNPKESVAITRGDLILIDLWAKVSSEHAVFADITWVGFAGSKDDIPARFREMFATVARARDRAIAFLREHIDNRPVFGYEVDDACREVIEKGGFGEHFTHRTGHSIGTTVHGIGPNIDNIETEDRRKLQEGHLFSIEPGIYMDDCGFRSEIDVLIGHNGIEVTTLPLQTEIIPLLE